VVALDAQLTADPAARLRAAAGGAPDVESALRIVVAKLLDGLTLPFTDLKSVAEAMHVRLQETTGLPVSAMLKRDEEGLKVVCAAEQSEGRRRFTIAHELGHAFLEIHGPGEPPRSGPAVETLCDRFAAELLMPTSLFRRELDGGISLELVLDLQRRYRTSLRATAIRCSRMADMAFFVADSRGLLWSTKQASTYNGFLRAVVRELLDAREPLRRDVRFRENDWQLEACLLPRSGDAVLCLTPAGQ
jgi:Zn-dependent peptidase ImmA (M78 family)